MGDDSTVFEGTLKSYNDQNGFGFIECPTTKQQYGCDVFVHRSEGQRMSIGSRVTFQVHLNKKGQPQANHVEVIGHNDSPNVVIPVNQAATVLQNSAVSFNTAGLTGPFLGRVKSNNPQQGYGFITCEQTQVLYNADVFLTRIEGHGLHPGQEVYFQVQLSNQGKPQAANVSVVTNKRNYESMSAGCSEMLPSVVPPGVAAVAAADTNWQSGAWHYQGMQQGQWGQSGCWQPENGLFSGSVKNFDHEVGYGSIHCDETLQLFGSDVFLHQNESDGLQVGSQVSFRIHVNENGQPQASSVSAVGGAAKRKRADAGAPPPPDPLHDLPLYPGTHVGRVKSYNSSTGSWLIECAVTKALFRQDVLLHKRQVVEGVDVGSKVSFQVRLKGLDEPHADSVELLANDVT